MTTTRTTASRSATRRRGGRRTRPRRDNNAYTALSTYDTDDDGTTTNLPRKAAKKERRKTRRLLATERTMEPEQQPARRERRRGRRSRRGRSRQRKATTEQPQPVAVADDDTPTRQVPIAPCTCPSVDDDDASTAAGAPAREVRVSDIALDAASDILKLKKRLTLVCVEKAMSAAFEALPEKRGVRARATQRAKSRAAVVKDLCSEAYRAAVKAGEDPVACARVASDIKDVLDSGDTRAIARILTRSLGIDGPLRAVDRDAVRAGFRRTTVAGDLETSLRIGFRCRTLLFILGALRVGH